MAKCGVERHQVGAVAIEVRRKAITRVRLSVHPPDGVVKLVVPLGGDLGFALAFAARKLDWIQAQQARLQQLPREEPKQFVTQERHSLWGDPYVLEVIEYPGKPQVTVEPDRILLRVRPGSNLEQRAAVIQAWHKSLLHHIIPARLSYWEPRLGVKVQGYSLQKMKTRWGSCHPGTGRVRFNTGLVEKPLELLEYVIVHELAHFRVANHGPQFVAILEQHYPAWREAENCLNPRISRR